ncbi:hypothetical protein R1flu_021641 [Riccia fluitans]|uniref:Uncharacterized protein n=1 Tax=Riccia fluitans TaxID=41844 RepID=A0ABD1ZPZ2_9MARC
MPKWQGLQDYTDDGGGVSADQGLRFLRGGLQTTSISAAISVIPVYSLLPRQRLTIASIRRIPARDPSGNSPVQGRSLMPSAEQDWVGCCLPIAFVSTCWCRGWRRTTPGRRDGERNPKSATRSRLVGLAPWLLSSLSGLRIGTAARCSTY